MPEPAIQPFAVGPSEGLSVENPTGGVVTFKAMADESGGALTAIDAVSAPGEGPPLHVHYNEDELIYTLQGRFRLKLAGKLLDAPAGSFVFIPRGTPHTWQNVGAGPARFFATLMPATRSFEQFFLRYAQLPAHERGFEAFARIAEETQAFEVLGPPLSASDPL